MNNKSGFVYKQYSALYEWLYNGKSFSFIGEVIASNRFWKKFYFRRGYSSGNIDAVCAIINNACTILETDVCNTLRQQLRQGYSAGYLDLTQAYNVMIQGRLQQMDYEQNRVLFLVRRLLKIMFVSCVRKKRAIYLVFTWKSLEVL